MISRKNLEHAYHDLINSDSTQTIDPFLTFDGYERSVTPDSARLLINLFDSNGYVRQDGTVSTIWVLIAHCSVNHIPFTLEGISGGSVFIRRKEIEL